MAEKKQPTKMETIDPQGSERFVIDMKDAKDYPLLSVHEFDGVKYRVEALMPRVGGVGVEFVRIAA